MTQDLASAFGEPATSRLRGLLPPRTGSASASNGLGSAEHVPAEPPRDETSPTGPLAPHEAAPEHAPPPRRRPTTAPGSGSRASVPPPPAVTTNRRWGMARVASREHVDLLVLCALREGPASARGIIERLRAESGGVLEAPERTVHTTLHRLTRNRLLHRVRRGATPGPHYGLTEAGERAARARARQWRLFARAVADVVAEPTAR